MLDTFAQARQVAGASGEGSNVPGPGRACSMVVWLIVATGCLFANAATAQNDYLEQIEAEARRLTDPDEADTAPPSAAAPSPETSISRLPEVDAGDAPAGAVVSRADPRAREFETHLSSLSPGAYSLYSLLNDTRKLDVVNLYVDSPRAGDDKLDSAIERILGYY